jgi:hypothetical protein
LVKWLDKILARVLLDRVKFEKPQRREPSRRVDCKRSYVYKFAE